MKKNIFVIIFIFALLIRIGLLSQKNDLHYDEFINISAASHTEFFQKRNKYFEKNKFYTGKELKSQLLFDGKSDMLQDLKSLRNGTGDVLHTNLYYSVFRIFFEGADGFNLNEYLIRAGLLNLILFSFSYFFMYKLLNMLFDDKKYVALGLFLAFCNSASISNTLFLRLYQMQEMLFILMVYLSVKYWNITPKLSVKNLLGFSCLTAFTLLSGYYAILFVALVYFAILIASRSKDTINFLTLSAILSTGLVLLLYPPYFDFIVVKFINPSIMDPATISNVVETPLWAIIIAAVNYVFFMFNHLCTALLTLYFIVIGAKLCKRKPLCAKSIWVITIICLIWGIAVLITCPHKVVRYVLPVLSLCAIFLTWILKCYDSKKQNVFVCSIILLNLLWVSVNTFFNFGAEGFTNIKPKKAWGVKKE
ncbi:hypothetical protein IJV79_04140 [bacterium]|nr:hypothetical protein [bacterium]